MSKAIQNGWISIAKEGGATKVIRVVESIDDTVRTKLNEVASGNATVLDAAALADLKKRKLLVQSPVIYYNIKRGADFTVQIVKLETELTPEMLASGSWKQKKFKPYNFQALGASLNSGHLHPLLKVRSEFRSILLEMGFSEMPLTVCGIFLLEL
ncbi:Phenylalanine--tRNA ligase alpha subunit [Orchesella cincta]|uniref:phenylalanine--tRNA ligase n=1 Tax=Orchesella cincta TaxID=48709 RepID=A0A1D2ME64_ORCCI|nr:Phenylalanine--tRNA ligase alpha subunit [Orchesella cincta]